MNTKKILALALTAIITITGNGNLYAAELPETENMAEVAGEISEEKAEGDYTYTVSNGCATITAYNGTEESVVTPETLGGYLVTEIGINSFQGKEVKQVVVSEGVVRVSEQAFMDCKSLIEISFPSTMQTLSYGGVANDTALKKIEVAKESPYFFSDEGVLFKYVEGGIGLHTYPAGKENEEYVVPVYVDTIILGSFSAVEKLKKIYMPSTVERIASHSFCRGSHALDVYLNHDELPDIVTEMFFNMPAGCHVIVKNEQLKNELEAINIFSTGLSYETPDSSVVVLGDEGYPAIPTASLTWEGSQTDMSHTLSPGEKCQLTYVQEPLNSTDNITWSSSDEKIARVDAVTGLVEASGGVNYPVRTGTCTITGTDESGHSISVDITVYKPVTQVDLYCNSYNPEEYTLALDDKTKSVRFEVRPFDANNRGSITWDSSNESIANVTSKLFNTATAGDNEQYFYNSAVITAVSTGETTITATLDDNGTIWTKSFVLTVTKDISNCTIAAVPDQNYTGSDIEPAIVVGDGEKTLVNGTDYEVNYSDNRAVGMASVSITGKGLYSGTSTVYFNIIRTGDNNAGSGTGDNNAVNNGGNGQKDDTNPASKRQPITGVGSSYKKAYGDKAFTLKAKAKGTVTYASDNSKVASVGKSTGKVSIKGTGTCTITVTAAKTGSYQETVKKITVSVSPKKETVTYAKSLKKNRITVKWKKDTKATGYQIQYSTSKKFTKKGTKIKTVAKNKTASGTVKKLKSGKTYYVRVRAYKTVKVNGKKSELCGSWSKVKAVKVK